MPVILDGDFSLQFLLDGSMNSSSTLCGELGEFIEVSTQEYPNYNGTYSIVPTTERQILASENTIMRANVVIEPIPSNYGLITYNGSIITVS